VKEENMVKITIGFSEALVLFAAAMLWHNFTVAMCTAGLACFAAFFRYAVYINEKNQAAEAQKETARILGEKAGDIGSVLNTILGSTGKSSSGPLH